MLWTKLGMGLLGMAGKGLAGSGLLQTLSQGLGSGKGGGSGKGMGCGRGGSLHGSGMKGSRSGKDLRVRHAGGRHSDGSFGLYGLGFRRIALSRLCFGSAGLSRGALLHAFRFCGRRLRSRRAFCGSRALRARSLRRVRAAARQQAGGQKRRCDQ